MERYGPLWQQRELDRILAGLRPASDVLSSLSPWYAECLRDMELLSTRFSLPPDFLSTSEEIRRLVDKQSLSTSFPEIASQNQSLLNAMESIERKMASLGNAVRAIEQSSNRLAAAIAESFVGTEALMKLTAGGARGIGGLTRVHESFERLAVSKLAFPNDATDAFKANTVEALAASAAFLPSMARASQLGALMGASGPVDFADMPEVNVFEELFEELPADGLDDPHLNVEAVVGKSPTSAIVDLGQRMVKLVYDLNTHSERSGDDALFKPTSKAMLAFHVIPTTAATEEDRFESIIDLLFFMLYEGTGRGTRLVARIGDDGLSALWLLKHLRLGARHDLDHGEDREARRKSAQVGDAYRKLIGKPVPKNREDWLLAQRALYQQLVDMLDQLWRDC